MEIKLVGGGGYDCNQFLVATDEAAMLVDAGTGMAADATLERVRKAAGDVDVTTLYVTHWHHDHTGGAPRLAEALDAEILMPEAEAHAIREGRADLTMGDKFGAQQETHPVTGVEPGDAVDVGPASFEVLQTPGHTAGHTSLWHEDSCSLLAGDVVFSHGSFGRVDLPTGDPDEMLESLGRLAGMGVQNLYPGHMEVVEGQAGKHVEMALSNARGRL